MKTKRELTELEHQEIQEAFDLFDTDGTGIIDVKEIKLVMRALGFEILKDELKAISMKFNSKSTIDYQEFLSLMKPKMKERNSRQEFIKAFKLFDQDETGCITLRDLQRVSKELGESLTKDELQEMIDVADKNGDGNIDQHEFLKVMKLTKLY